MNAKDVSRAMAALAEVAASPIEESVEIPASSILGFDTDLGTQRNQFCLVLRLGPVPEDLQRWCASVLAKETNERLRTIRRVYFQRLSQHPTDIEAFVGIHAMLFCSFHHLGNLSERAVRGIKYGMLSDAEGCKCIIYSVSCPLETRQADLQPAMSANEASRVPAPTDQSVPMDERRTGSTAGNSGQRDPSERADLCSPSTVREGESESLGQPPFNPNQAAGISMLSSCEVGGHKLGQLFEELASSEKERVSSAMRELRSSGSRAIPGLRETLRAGNLPAKAMAAQVLGNIGPTAREAAHEIEPLLKHGSPAVQIIAHGALAQIGQDRPKHLDALIGYFDSQGDFAERAHKALVRVGAAAVPILVEALKQGGYKRFMAARVLGTLGARAAASLPALEEARRAEDGSSEMSEQIIEALDRAISNVRPAQTAAEPQRPSPEPTARDSSTAASPTDRTLVDIVLDRFEDHLRSVNRVQHGTPEYPSSRYCSLIEGYMVAYFARDAFVHRHWKTDVASMLSAWLGPEQCKPFFEGNEAFLAAFRKGLASRALKHMKKIPTGSSSYRFEKVGKLYEKYIDIHDGLIQMHPTALGDWEPW